MIYFKNIKINMKLLKLNTIKQNNCKMNQNIINPFFLRSQYYYTSSLAGAKPFLHADTAKYAKLPQIPPVLQPTVDYSNGINFASGGAGVLAETNQGLVN